MYIEVYIDILGRRDQAAEKFFKWQKGEGKPRSGCSRIVHGFRNFGAKVQKYL